MRKRTCFLPQAGALLMLVLTVCACTSAPKGCTIEGKVRDGSYEGKQVYLQHTLTRETYDSTAVKDGAFRFTLGETSPEVSLLVLKASSDDLFPVTLPVVTEKGVVKVVLGELVLTSGTDLNDRLQDFLLAVDRFGDEMAGKGESHGKIKKDFSGRTDCCRQVLQSLCGCPSGCQRLEGKGRKRQQARRGVLLWCGHRGRPVQHEQPVLRKQSRTFLQCTPYCGGRLQPDL